MAVFTGKKLSDGTFRYPSLNLASPGTQVVIPNTSQYNNGEFGPSNKLVKVFVNGSIMHDTTDYTVNRVTANAHKIVFVNPQIGEDILIEWQLG